ncbi:MAG: RNA polymerase sigma factor [Actinomycetia bacterium]|nr:RNA polymerase sigma factor [Actinomycetes bacterium]
MSDQAEALTRHGPDLLAYFRRRVGDNDAADLLSETMVVAWRRIAVLPEDDESARRWLFGIARNVLLNASRTQRRQARLADRLRSQLSATAVAAAADTGVEVRDAIARLDPHLAEIVRLVHWEGFTLKETAEILGAPASTVRSHYQRARTELATLLRAHSPA